ncbi:MAG: SoxR reducing system RseC family protein [Deltaproteobacteria bacterium]|nr:SoxR reducing system RseC family protein [Deltaproteobacteria bacterium]
MINTTCGTISSIDKLSVEVKIDRKASCQGCQASDICHSFTKKNMDLHLSKPRQTVHVGDTVIIALESASFLKACVIAFMIPLIFVVISLAITMWLDIDVSLQALSAVIAFGISLFVVRWMGKTIRSPRIVEVIHEE